jgi:UDP-glucose 4-epimerase
LVSRVRKTGVFAGKRALVTGGLGFIGSNLAVRLLELGATVSIVDSSVAGCGADTRNLEAVWDQLRLIPLDIAAAVDFQDDIASADFIFNLAGEISHTRSMQTPERDLALNVSAQLRFLEICRRARPGVRVVYAGTRQVYGHPKRLPVDESHGVEPVDFNGIHKLAAEQYHLLLSSRGELDAAVIRLTNVYGPRLALGLPWQGFLGVYVRNALLGEPLLVYGNGEQLRDPLYVDDAVNAFLMAAAAPKLPSRIYNAGGAERLSVAGIARKFASASGSTVRHVPFPQAKRAIDIGSYYADCTRLGADLGWRPAVSMTEGIDRTLNYYRSHSNCYSGTPATRRVSVAPGAGSLVPAAPR